MNNSARTDNNGGRGCRHGGRINGGCGRRNIAAVEIPKTKMITPHPRMAMATVVAKMVVVLAMVSVVTRIFIQAANDLLVGLSAALSC
eukprot:708497-Ditylum_brightwellii.AAC.1